jgi:hypothetical protein
MANAEREPVWRSGGFAPSGVQGQSPWSGGQGANPPEANDILILGYKFSELRMHLRHTYAGLFIQHLMLGLMLSRWSDIHT